LHTWQDTKLFIRNTLTRGLVLEELGRRTEQRRKRGDWVASSSP
jgi:hypothetical protein